MNSKVDQYLIDGCMRCKYGGTPQCKVNHWRKELELLRHIVLETGLSEEVKWGIPVYTYKGKNVVSVNAFKQSANISFFKGVLLNDKHKLLQQQGNMQSARIVRFNNTDSISQVKETLQSYIAEAIRLEDSGKKVEFKKNPEPVPEELLRAFNEDPAFKTAFHRLTPGRQRAYIIHYSQPKQESTRTSRIEKSKQNIFKGIGLNDRHKGK